MKKCKSCGFDNIDGAKFCKNCGTKFEEKKLAKFCRFCGKQAPEGTLFCTACGKSLEMTANNAAPQPQQPQKPAEPKTPIQISPVEINPVAAKPVKSQNKVLPIIIAAAVVVVAVVLVVGAVFVIKGGLLDKENDNDENEPTRTEAQVQDETDSDEYIDENTETEMQEEQVKETETQEEVIEETESTELTQEEQDYILPTSNTEYLTMEDLEGLTAEECRIARNELYARYGRKFLDETLQAYFDAKSWYKGVIEPEDFNDLEWLNEYEIANRDLIVEYETEKGYR